jgi:Tfp pilus assembly protein PilO
MQRILNNREKIILFVTLWLISLSLAYNFILEPLLNRYSTLNQEIGAVKAKIKKYLLLLSQKEDIQKKYERLSSPAFSPGEEKGGLVGILAEIESLAKNSGINILDIRPQTPRSGQTYKEALIELRTEGVMESYLKFIYDIENSLFLLRIKEFQLNSKPNSQLLEATFFISKLSLD